jgi:formylglycine-generating enzyme required for sulfatase activity
MSDTHSQIDARNSQGFINEASGPINQNFGAQIINNYLGNGGQQRDPQRLARQVASYLRWVRERYGKIELRGIQRGGVKVLSLDLDQVYVPLAATMSAPAEERSGLLGLLDKLRKSKPKAREISLLEEAHMVKAPIELDQVLELNNRLVITGGPGCGKTTVLLHLAWALAASLLDGSDLAKERLGLDHPLPLPIFIPLATYARYLRELKAKPGAPARERTLSSFISHYLIRRDADFDLPDDFFVRLLRDGRSVLLLLDGLDEVSNEDEREVVRQAVEELVAGRPDLRVIVTCRTAAYKGRTALGSGFREVVVKPLEEQHIRAIVGRFYDFVYPGQPNQAQAQTDELMAGIEQLERARGDSDPLIDSPLMVRLLLIVRYNDRRMPEQRAELFMKAAETMIQLDYLPDVEVQQTLKEAVGNSWTDQYEMVQHLAFHMHSQGQDQGREIDEDALRQAFADSDYAGYVDALINYTRNRGGLLEERMGAYRFIHLGFQEYLTARHLIKVVGSSGGLEAIAAFFEAGPILESWWREPALLIPGYYAADSNSATARAFLRRLSGLTRKAGAPLAPEVQLAAAEVAANAALELRDLDDKLRADLAARLTALYQTDEVMNTATPVRRAAAGVALGRLGDPRAEVMDVDAMRLCLVPAGPFCMGSPADDKDAYDDERSPEPQCDVPYAYAITQHPITNAQYQQFVADDGYANPDWWDVAIADGCWANGKVRRRWLVYEDEKREKIGERFEEGDAPRDFGSPFNLPNHPVVDVNWYEALAFTRWLTARWRERGWLTTDQQIQLPNEPEWEKAARGGLAMPPEPVVATIQDLDSVARGFNPKSEIVNPNSTRRYPWGDEPDPNRANYDDTHLGNTSAAGCFPNGGSPYACHDMSGNVWEWTRSVWGPWKLEEGTYNAELKYPYPYNSVDGREDLQAGLNMARVLRGGAFLSDHRSARVAFRNWYRPVVRLEVIGFRVVVSPISL